MMNRIASWRNREFIATKNKLVPHYVKKFCITTENQPTT